MPIDELKLSPQVIAKRIRDKVEDLNDELTLAALAEVKVEFEVHYDKLTGGDHAYKLVVWCSQEV